MLKVTLDIYSGRPNPSWTVSGEAAEAALRGMANMPAMLAGRRVPPGGLGYRGTRVDLLSDAAGLQYNMPTSSTIAVPGTPGASHGVELVHRLLAAAPWDRPVELFGAAAVHAGSDERDFLSAQVAMAVDAPPAVGTFTTATNLEVPNQVITSPPTTDGCPIEMGPFNPTFWNDPAHISLNNCYAYASNRRTDTFPQPGKATGRQASSMSCVEVTAASKRDGAHDATDCLSDNQKPRWHVALVVWPGRDYHWYRQSKEGFWSHKPGQTSAVNVDQSGHVVMDPSTCDRGGYTAFCGFMVLPRDQKVA